MAFSVFMTSYAQAELQCDVDLRYGFIVNDKHIRVVDEQITRYQINGDNQLIVGGHWIQLDEEQQADIKALSDEVHDIVPNMILLAVEGVELAVDTVQHVYVGLVGSDHQSYDKIESSLERVKRKVHQKFIHAGDNYYIGPGSLEDVDEFVDEELEEELESAISTSLGGILSAIGGLTSNNDANMEKRIDELSQRLEQMGEEIERTVGPKAGTLRKKAQWFCNRIEQLNDIEERLRSSIKQLEPYDVIVVGEKELSER
ncbi:YggN family protein [Paraneptunicella aestuarii]|nr:DUF2884 family protein [Paraneptunicella aestuarii]UAA40833.1 YggN family protein [Paraneptunicella aestuarii]